MDILIARQPIYNRNLKVFAYELLYRNNTETNTYPEVNGDSATVSVIMGTFLSIGIETVTNKKPGFINFTANLLKSDVVKMLPTRYLGIEILEDIEPTNEILNVCKELKAIGYTIALDDYLYSESSKKFIQYANIIKMDFLQASDKQLQDIVYKYKRKGIKFLAEKIETKEDFIKAKSYGYDYFQGYYFSRPSLIQKKDILPLQVNALKVLELLQNDDCDINEIASIISYDPGMVYKLFKMVNSVFCGGRRKITKINIAIMRIGLKELQTWIFYILLYGMNADKPDELIRQSILRARAAEELCAKKKLSSDISSFSLMGLFSLMDVIMDTPFETILSYLSISKNITNALINPGDDIYGSVVRVIRSYDEADWDEAEKAGKLIDLSLDEYQDIYLRAAKWCDTTYDSLFIE